MFKKLAPGFLNRLDTFLLTNYPLIWISKIHYVVWFGALLYLVSALIGFLVPVNLTSTADNGLWFFLLSVLSFILSWFWGYRYLAFNKEKNFGNLNFKDEYLNFFLVFLSITVFAWFASPFVLSHNLKIAKLYTDKEVINDINTLNEIECYVPTNSYAYENTYDTLKKERYFNVNKPNAYNGYTPYQYLNDTINFPLLLSSYKLLQAHIAITDYNTLKAKIALHISICKKYGVVPNINADEVANFYLKASKAGWLNVQDINSQSDYHKGEMRIAFNNLFEAKFGTLFIWDKDFLWGMFYFIFSLSVLLILFKSTYWQQFLILVIVLALYPLLAFILSQILFNYSGRELAFQWFIFLLFITCIVSLFLNIKKQKVFVPFLNILNQLFFLVGIYMPMVVVNYLKDNTALFLNYSNYNYGIINSSAKKQIAESGLNLEIKDFNYYLDQFLYEYWQKEFDFWFLVCKVVPIIIFIICLPFMKKLFVNQLALPKKT